MIRYDKLWMKLIQYLDYCFENDDDKTMNHYNEQILHKMADLYTQEAKLEEEALYNDPYNTIDSYYKFALICSEDICILFSKPFVMFPLYAIDDGNLKYTDFDKIINTIYRAFNMNKPKHINIKIEGESEQ